MHILHLYFVRQQLVLFYCLLTNVIFFQMEQELKEQREQASSFRAKPAEVLYEAPFVPMKSNKALTGGL